MIKYCWEQYLVIEKEFIEAKKYVSFVQENYGVVSTFFRNEIILLGSELENGFKKLGKLFDHTQNPGNIRGYKELILKFCPKIVEMKVGVIGTGTIELKPYKNWDTGNLVIWDNYNDIKHGVGDSKPTLKLALDLLAAYEIVLFLIHLLELKSNNNSFGYKNDELMCYYIGECPMLLKIQQMGSVSYEMLFNGLIYSPDEYLGQ